MLPYGTGWLSKIVLIAFFIVLAGYGYYELRGILYGPRIDVPSGVQEAYEPYILIQGHVEHISSLSMNGHPVSVTEDGYFEEPYLLSPGLNRILLDAEDTYGQKRQEVVHIFYTRSATSTNAVWPETTPESAVSTSTAEQ
jgi:hypothetical protein